MFHIDIFIDIGSNFVRFVINLYNSYILGYQMSRPTCLNKANEKEVDERLCDGTSRPVPEIKECNPEKCPPV